MQVCHSATAIRNVLFATDFSEESAHAIEYVRSLRQGYDAKIHVVHVADLFPYSLSDDPAAKREAEHIQHQAEARIRDFMLVHQFDRKHFEPSVVSGEVFMAVEKFSGEHNIDLILLGSRGDLGINRIFLGSTAEEIFRTARCPVMIVGPHASVPQKDGRFHQLLFATDLSPHSRAAMAYGERLLRDNPRASITLAHFVSHDGRQHPVAQIQSELLHMLPADLSDRVAAAIVKEGPPAQSMVEMASAIHADLLILGVRYGGSFLRAATHGLFSITHQVIGKSPCPVLTVRGSQPAV